jgi:C1A family cysteine protease
MKKTRLIDESVRKNYSWIKQKIVMMNKKNITTWHGVFFLAFLIGVATSIIWMANYNIQITSQATSGSSNQPSPNQAEIDKINKENGGKWKAKETTVSILSLEDKKKLVSEKKFDLSGVKELPSKSTSVTPPASLDWNNNSGGDYVTPVRNQGSCGSCWAFAVTAALESYTLIANNQPNGNLDLSEQTLVSCGNAGSCSGGYISSASSYFKSTGLPVESCYPYTAANGSCSSACANWQSSAYKIANYGSVSANAANLENAITNYGPVVTTMAVYNDFYYYAGGVYKYTSGSLIGYHAITIIGYDHDNQYFTVKNSWGSGWGESGFFRISYSEIGGTSQFGGQSIAYYSSSPSDTVSPSANITSPSSGATVSGTVPVSASASDNVGVAKAEFYMDSSLQTTDTSSPYSFNWDTTKVTNGSHTLSAKAYDAAGNVGTSASITVNVSNTAPMPDAIAPTVTISSPADGSTTSKNTKLSASSSDNIGVISMQASIDGKSVCTSSSGALSCTIVNKKFAKGTHPITVIASDAAGNKGTAVINVNMQ